MSHDMRNDNQGEFTEEMWNHSLCRSIILENVSRIYSLDGFVEQGQLVDFITKYIKMRSTRVETSTNSSRSTTLLNNSKREIFNVDAIKRSTSDHSLKDAIVKNMLSPGPISDLENILSLYRSFIILQEQVMRRKVEVERENLPIAAFRESILTSVARNRVTIIAGETGCGKSTQVPQFLLQSGYCRIACTQPRRLSAVSLCRRVAFETHDKYGNEVGYKIRFDASATSATRIVFLTEGVLLRELYGDSALRKYDIVVCDEVHERHLTCDFLLGLLKAVLVRNNKLKVVLMSATLDSQLFSQFFDGAPIVNVPGRTYNVNVEYFVDENEARHFSKNFATGGKRVAPLDTKPYTRLLAHIDATVPTDERGDLLVFLSGMSDMLALQEAFRDYLESSVDRCSNWIVLLLHSTLNTEDQDKVFAQTPARTRKCILATNIAESAVTIEGIRFVADSGRAKEMSFDPIVGVKCLREKWVSKASAEQRKGRAGRTGPGVCYRLYPFSIFDAMDSYSTPEITRSNLENLILQIKVMGMNDPRNFPFLTSPLTTHMNASLKMLRTLGTTIYKRDQNFSAEEVCKEIACAPLTPLGYVLAKLPVEPMIGKVLVLGHVLGIGEIAGLFSAVLSMNQSPFEGNGDERLYRSFGSEYGDAFAVCNAYRAWLVVKSERKISSRRWCKKHGIKEQRMYEISKQVQQFSHLLRDIGTKDVSCVNLKHLSPSRDTSNRLSRRELRKIRAQQETMMRASLNIDHDRDENINEEPDSEQQIQLLREEFVPNVTYKFSKDRLDVNSLEFYSRHSTSDLNRASERSILTSLDICILLAILSMGLYPQIALPDPNNDTRRLTECQFSTHFSAYSAFLSPDSVLSVEDIGKNLICYGALIDTHKPFLSMITKVPSYQSLVLSCTEIDTSEDAKTLLFDRSLLCELELTSEKENGISLLTKACELRQHISYLLNETLKSSEDMCYASELLSNVESNSIAEALPPQLNDIRQQSCTLNHRRKNYGNEDLRKLTLTLFEFMKLEITAAYRKIGSEEASVRLGSVIDNSNIPEYTRGVEILPNVRWNSLYPVLKGEYIEQRSIERNEKWWRCPVCNVGMVVNQGQLEAHRETCCVRSEKSFGEMEPKRRKIIGTRIADVST